MESEKPGEGDRWDDAGDGKLSLFCGLLGPVT